MPGVNNIDQLAEVFATNPNAVNDIVEAFKALNAQYRSVNEKPDPRLDYAKTTESTDQKAPDPDTLETDEEGFDYFLNLEQEVRDQLGYDSESNVSDKSFIPVTHDKKLVKVKINGKDTYIVERGIDGSFNDWYIETRSGVISSNQPIDNAKINDPDFLSNKELKDNDVEATLIIPDTPYNQRLREQNKLTYENVEIHMMVGDTFIGTVPNIREEVSENFKALRQTVFNQQQGTTQGIQVATSINPKLKEILNGLGYSNTKIDSLTKEEIEYISKNKIPVEEFVSREENIKENFENITKQLEDLVKESIIPGSELNEMMSKFMDETGEFKKC